MILCAKSTFFKGIYSSGSHLEPFWSLIHIGAVSESAGYAVSSGVLPSMLHDDGACVVLASAICGSMLN